MDPGSLTTRTDGALIVRVTDPESGQRRKRIVKRRSGDGGRLESPAQHRKHAETVLGELKADLTRPTTMREQWTVEDYARDRYLPSLTQTLKPNTLLSYRKELELYVFPYVGDMEMAKLTADDVDRLDRTLTSRGYSVVVRRKARGVLGRVVRHGVRKHRLNSDVTQFADKLARDDRDRTKGTLQPEQVR